MKKFKKILMIWFLISSTIFYGCAGTGKLTTLKPEDIKNIKKMAIVTSLLDKEPIILDHTGIKQEYPNIFMSSGYGGLAGYLVGAIAEITVKEIRTSARINSVLGGDPDTLRQAVGNFPIKLVFDETVDKIFSKSCEFTSPQDFKGLGIDDFPIKKSENGKTTRDYSTLYNKLNINTVLEINFVYGLAICRYEIKPTATIVADVSLINIEENKLCMKKVIFSDFYYKKGYTLDEFKANEAALFKREISEVMSYIVQLLASELGAASPPDVVSLKQTSFWNKEK